MHSDISEAEKTNTKINEFYVIIYSFGRSEFSGTIPPDGNNKPLSFTHLSHVTQEDDGVRCSTSAGSPR